MKLHSVMEMGPVAGVCCRQSRLRKAVGALIWLIILVGGIFFWRQVGAPSFIWGGWAVLARLFVPVVIRGTLAKFRPTNWVLRTGPDGLWINLRSLEARAPAEGATVVQVSYEEIDHAHRHIDTWTTPAQKNSLAPCHWKLESLDLHLVSDGTRDLARALSGERAASNGVSPSVAVPALGVTRMQSALADFTKRANKPKTGQAIYSDKPVKVGETWKLTEKGLALIIDDAPKDALDPKQIVGMGKLLNAYQKNGQQWGVVEVVVTGTAKKFGPLQLSKPVEFQLKATLETAIDGSSTEGEMKGQMSFKGQSEFTQNDMTFNIDIDLVSEYRQVQSAEK